MSRNRRYRYAVTVLTPLHIGSGETIPLLAYDFTVPGSATCLDLSAAATERFRRGNSADLSFEAVADFARNNRDIYGKYTLQAPPIPHTRGIAEYIKVNGKPYLPGSSLKGAIRTAILSAVVSEGRREEFERALRNSLSDNDITKPHLTDKAEQAVWSSDPHHDPLRGLRIGDSGEVSPQDHLTISEVRVMGLDLTLKPQLELTLFWERLGKKEERAHLPTPHRATRIFLETLQPGTILEGELSLNAFLLEEPWVKELLGFRGKAEFLLPKQLTEECRRRYGALFRQELILYRTINLFSKGQLDKVVKHLDDIQQNEAPVDNEFFLQLSGGTGWRAKTVAEQIDQLFLLKEVNAEERFFQDSEDRQYALADFRILPLGQQDLLSPKTRRLIMEGDTPAWPLGWVKVSLHEIDST